MDMWIVLACDCQFLPRTKKTRQHNDNIMGLLSDSRDKQEPTAAG